jgi:hypothetical protein
MQPGASWRTKTVQSSLGPEAGDGGVDDFEMQVQGDLGQLVTGEVRSVVDVQQVRNAAYRPRRVGLRPDRWRRARAVFIAEGAPRKHMCPQLLVQVAALSDSTLGDALARSDEPTPSTQHPLLAPVDQTSDKIERTRLRLTRGRDGRLRGTRSADLDDRFRR